MVRSVAFIYCPTARFSPSLSYESSTYCSSVPITTMASADFSRQLLSMYQRCFNMSVKPPRVRTITFNPSTCCIYHEDSVQYGALICMAISPYPLWPYMQFLFVRPGICLRLRSELAWRQSGSTSRWTPLPSANTSYCKACSGLAPYSYRPCRAHHKKALKAYSQGLIYLFKKFSITQERLDWFI